MLRFLVSIGIALLLVSGCVSAPAPTATPTSPQAPVTEPTPTAEGDTSSVPTDSAALTS
jgi:hypothetical protein